MDKFKTYIAIPRQISAIQYTGTTDNIKAITELVGEAFASGLLRVLENDWIVKSSDEYEVMTDDEFQATFREAIETATKTK